jgi:polysaccharide biosynthesis protein PslJ
MRDATRNRLVSLAVLGAAGMILVVVSVLVGSGGHRAGQLGVGILVAVGGFAVVLLHPGWIYRSLAFVLGAVPVATIPGLGTPIVLVLAIAVWLAVLTHPIVETRTYPIELSIVVLIITSLASLVMTATAIRDITEFLKWVIATSMVFALLRLDRNELRAFGRTFAFGACAGAAFSLALLFIDKSGAVSQKLAVIGIQHLPDGAGLHRLTGTYVEPNSAGIFLMIALAVGIALLRGWQRFLVAPIILAGLVCTLSRSAMLSVVAAAVFLLIFQPMPARIRALASATLIGGGVAIFSLPVIHARFTSTFKDRGSLDRAASLADYVHNMTGSWWFGKGWGLPEIVSDAAAFRVNHVANSPLLSIYRGGIFVGLAFVLVLVIGVVIAYRNAYKRPWESGVIGAQFVGFTAVGMQLDFPIVTHSPVTMVWSVLIAFLAANPVGARITAPGSYPTHFGLHSKAAGA